MIVHDCQQGSPQWKALRLGIPTASEFNRILTPKGKPSKSQDPYIFDLIAERITGEPADQFSSKWTIRGSALEAEAVKYYEFQVDCETKPIGFITNDAGTVGASPDRFVTPGRYLEIKAPKPGVHISYLVQSGAVYEDHMIQAQSQLWIAEAEQVDLVSYCPALPWVVETVRRDDEFIKALEEHVPAFLARLEELYGKLVKEGIAPESWASSWGARAGNAKGRTTAAPTAHEQLSQAVRDSLIALQQDARLGAVGGE